MTYLQDDNYLLRRWTRDGAGVALQGPTCLVFVSLPYSTPVLRLFFAKELDECFLL